jgi:IclR family acetate operon transcriptional repressor
MPSIFDIVSWHEEWREGAVRSVNLAVLDRDEMLFLDVIESRSSLRMVSGIGTREPVHSTAIGKAVAAELSQEELEALLSRDVR